MKRLALFIAAAVLAFTTADAVVKNQPPASGGGSVSCASMPALTGDATSSAASCATTLATVNSNVGSFTAANITVDGKGRITAATNGGGGQVVSSFAGVLTGMSSGGTGTVNTYVSGNTATLVASFTGTSNSTSMTLTGLPVGLQPVTLDQQVTVVLTNNGISTSYGCALISHASGTIFFFNMTGTTCLSNAFTGTGTKGFSTAGQSTVITYLLN